MLYFTGEVFRRLANQNQGHIRVMLESDNVYKTTLHICFHETVLWCF